MDLFNDKLTSVYNHKLLLYFLIISKLLSIQFSGPKCAEKHGISNWDSISTCAEGPEGQELLAQMGDRTHDLKPKVTFIPTIKLDGSLDRQRKILKNLKAEVCSFLVRIQVTFRWKLGFLN